MSSLEIKTLWTCAVYLQECQNIVNVSFKFFSNLSLIHFFASNICNFISHCWDFSNSLLIFFLLTQFCVCNRKSKKSRHEVLSAEIYPLFVDCGSPSHVIALSMEKCCWANQMHNFKSIVLAQMDHNFLISSYSARITSCLFK